MNRNRLRRMFAGVLGGGGGAAPAPVDFTDDFARSDGAVGNGWTGGTWSIASGKVINTPNLGAELVTDGAMENWTTPTDLTDWTDNPAGASTVNQDTSDKHGGASSVRMDVDGAGSAVNITQSLAAVSANGWIHLDLWAKSVSTRSVRAYIQSMNSLLEAYFVPGAAWVNGLSTHRVTAANKSLILVKSNQVSQSLWWDDVSAKLLTESELSLTRPIYPTPDYVISVAISALQQNTLAGIRFAMDDPTNPQNYLLAVMNNANAFGNLMLYKVLNGTMTRLQNIGQPFSAGNILKVAKNGTSVRVFLNDVPMFATQTVSDAAIKDNLYAGTFSTYVGNTLDDWSETVRAVGGSDAFLLPFFSDYFIFPIGDSVTAGTTDEVNGTGYPVILTASLQAQTSHYWAEKPARYAVGGYTVADIKAGIDAALASRSDTPNYILILLGTNDVVSMSTEADWKADYNYILDALHAKWINTNIYLGSSYRANELTDLTTLKTWMADLIAERSFYCFAGMDSYPLYNGHPELLSDGLHPNHAGFVQMADAWKVNLGY